MYLSVGMLRGIDGCCISNTTHSYQKLVENFHFVYQKFFYTFNFSSKCAYCNVQPFKCDNLIKKIIVCFPCFEDLSVVENNACFIYQFSPSPCDPCISFIYENRTQHFRQLITQQIWSLLANKFLHSAFAICHRHQPYYVQSRILQENCGLKISDYFFLLQKTVFSWLWICSKYSNRWRWQ